MIDRGDDELIASVEALLSSLHGTKERLGAFAAAYRKLLRLCQRQASAMQRRERQIEDAEDRVGDLSLEWQRSKDREKTLLCGMLPEKIAARLAERPHELVVDEYPMVTIVSAALADFDRTVGALDAAKLVESLNQLFSVFDVMAEQRGVERVRTMGDSYMCVSGAPEAYRDHASRAAELALDMISLVTRLRLEEKSPLSMRIGIHSGPVAAGVIGERRPSWDLFGASVRTAILAQLSCPPGSIQATESFRAQAGAAFRFEPAGAKGAEKPGKLWILTGRERGGRK